MEIFRQLMLFCGFSSVRGHGELCSTNLERKTSSLVVQVCEKLIIPKVAFPCMQQVDVKKNGRDAGHKTTTHRKKKTCCDSTSLDFFLTFIKQKKNIFKPRERAK
jgi:hypothetical protein